MRRRALPPYYPKQGTSISKPIVVSDEMESGMPKSMIDIPRNEMLPLYLTPQIRPPPKPLDNFTKETSSREFEN